VAPKSGLLISLMSLVYDEQEISARIAKICLSGTDFCISVAVHLF